MADLSSYILWYLGLEAHISKASIVDGGLTPPPSRFFPGTKCYMVTVTVDGCDHLGFGPTPIIAKNAALQVACDSLAKLELDKGFDAQEINDTGLKLNNNAPELIGTAPSVDNTVPEADNAMPESDNAAPEEDNSLSEVNDTAQHGVNCEKQGMGRSVECSQAMESVMISGHQQSCCNSLSVTTTQHGTYLQPWSYPSPMSHPPFCQISHSQFSCVLVQSLQVPQPPAVLQQALFHILNPPLSSYEGCTSHSVTYSPPPQVPLPPQPHVPLPPRPLVRYPILHSLPLHVPHLPAPDLPHLLDLPVLELPQPSSYILYSSTFPSPRLLSDGLHTTRPLVSHSVPYPPSLSSAIPLQPTLPSRPLLPTMLASDPPLGVAHVFSHAKVAALCPPSPKLDLVHPSPVPLRFYPPGAQSKDPLQNTDNQSIIVGNEINLCSISPFNYSTTPDSSQFTVRLPKAFSLKTSSKPQWKDYSNKQQSRLTRGRVWNGVNELGEILGDGNNRSDPFNRSLKVCAMMDHVGQENLDLGFTDVAREEKERQPVPSPDQVKLDMIDSSFADFYRKEVKLDTWNKSNTDPIALPTHFVLQHDLSDPHDSIAKADGLTKGHNFIPTCIFDWEKYCQTQVVKLNKPKLKNKFKANIYPKSSVCVCLPSEGPIPK